MTRQLAYIGAPYSHADPAVQVARFEAINRCCALLMREGVKLYSPISHTHPIALAGKLPTGWEYWRDYDETMLSVCTSLCVLKLVSWKQSTGLLSEVAIATRRHLPVYYTEVDEASLDVAARWLKHPTW